jgi:hypothetical protein
VKKRLNFQDSGAQPGGGTGRSSRKKNNPGFHMMNKMNTNVERSAQVIPRSNQTDPDNTPKSHRVVFANGSNEKSPEKILKKRKASRQSRKISEETTITVNPVPNRSALKSPQKPALKLQNSMAIQDPIKSFQKSVTIQDPINGFHNSRSKSPDMPHYTAQGDYPWGSPTPPKDFVRNENNFKPNIGRKGNKLLESDYLGTEQDEPADDFKCKRLDLRFASHDFIRIDKTGTLDKKRLSKLYKTLKMNRRKMLRQICEVSVDNEAVWKAIEQYLGFWETFKAYVDPLPIFHKELETIFVKLDPATKDYVSVFDPITDNHEQSLRIWMKIEYDIGQKVNHFYWMEYKGDYCIDYHELR